MGSVLTAEQVAEIAARAEQALSLGPYSSVEERAARDASFLIMARAVPALCATVEALQAERDGQEDDFLKTLAERDNAHDREVGRREIEWQKQTRSIRDELTKARAENATALKIADEAKRGARHLAASYEELRAERDALRARVAELEAERDAANADRDAKHADLVAIADKLAAHCALVGTLQAERDAVKSALFDVDPYCIDDAPVQIRALDRAYHHERIRAAKLGAASRSLYGAVVAYVEQYGLEHGFGEGIDCPEDDTCECKLVQDVESGLQSVQAALAADAKEPGDG